ncbi:capsular polysaccharide transport system permease protein [Novosphingobium sp. PhB57]|uniref:sugar ABC transporter n=1 Tax=Novosphingobium sp. PhB57 TaxID=2485107 RepID=UPI00104DBBEE|nr:sugar ABC transporter [Novosphingobium sp. PhB57]TCU59822.1 capsular polysaccharide transport system permease protein [Novosphingobium sp. PhB57]
MTQNSFSNGQEVATPAQSRALVLAHEVRARASRERRNRNCLIGVLLIGTFVAAMGWATLIEKPRFAAESRFSVRGTNVMQAGAAGATGFLATGSGAAGAGFVDGFAVNDFLKSRDSMLQLAKRVDLPRILHVDPAAGSDVLYRAYGEAVSVKFKMVEQENVVEVSAYSPGDSRRMAEALLAQAQLFVSRMDDQGVQNTLDVDARQLGAAQDKAIAAANAVAAWRAENHNIDPEAEASMVMTMIGQIEQELNTARINYAKVKAFDNPDHPMLQTARMQVSALEAQLEQARQRLAGSSTSQAARLRTYTELKNAQTFTDNNLAAARDAYQQAYRETTRLRRYLTVIARPVASDRPTSPDLPMVAIEALLAGGVLTFLLMLGLSLFRGGRR